jgi:hypothetical protein
MFTLSFNLLIHFRSEFIVLEMDTGVKRLPIAALGEKMPNILLVGIIIAKQTPQKVICKSGKHFMALFSLNFLLRKDISLRYSAQ